jgi:hypothetical protein
MTVPSFVEAAKRTAAARGTVHAAALSSDLAEVTELQTAWSEEVETSGMMLRVSA